VWTFHEYANKHVSTSVLGIIHRSVINSTKFGGLDSLSVFRRNPLVSDL
jgi:hypothetical protein